jgi:transmembrane sensor
LDGKLVTAPPTDDRSTPVREAAAWVARLHAEDRSAADEAGFRRWIAADPANVQAFDRASAVWASVGGIAGRVKRTQAKSTNRRAVLASLTATVAAGGMGVWGYAHAGVYETAVGEQRRVTLHDGSHLLLDTATRLRVRMHDDRREIRVRTGRACLEVAADPRPFVIVTATRQVVARNGQIDVRCDQDDTAIVVSAGQAQVSGGPAPRALSVGERLRVGRDGGADAVDHPNLDDLLAWQSGRAVFRDQTLASAAEEMNRYTERKLVVADPNAAGLRLSGVYRVGDTAAFANAVAMLLPVRVVQTPDAILIDPV